ncbi:hypothetical protein JHK82_012509 [Glycine max]|nr:hypothetical protein JHK82_012509 [Glycine max]
MKSLFFRRRGFFLLSESSVRYGNGGSSSWRSKSIANSMFLWSSGVADAAAFSSSRLRCRDPGALLWPERFTPSDPFNLHIADLLIAFHVPCKAMLLGPPLLLPSTQNVIVTSVELPAISTSLAFRATQLIYTS